MFRGANAISLDAKGRLAMPSRYRDELISRSSGQLIVTIDAVDPCLCVYPLDEWELIETKLRTSSTMPLRKTLCAICSVCMTIW